MWVTYRAEFSTVSECHSVCFYTTQYLFWSVSHRWAFLEYWLPTQMQFSQPPALSSCIKYILNPLRVTIFNVYSPYNEEQPLVSLLYFTCAPPTSVGSLVVFSLAPPFANRQISAEFWKTLHIKFFSDFRTCIHTWEHFIT